MRVISAISTFTLAGLAVLAMGVGPAAATPIVDNPWATLPTGTNITAITADALGNSYTVDITTGNVSRIDRRGAVSASWASAGTTAKPQDLVALDDGTLFVADREADDVLRVDPSQSTTRVLLPAGSEPRSITRMGSSVFVASTGTSMVAEIRSDGTVVPAFASLPSPPAMIESNGTDLYTLNSNRTISRISSTGSVTASHITLPPGASVSSFAATPDGRVFASESTTNRVTLPSAPARSTSATITTRPRDGPERSP